MQKMQEQYSVTLLVMRGFSDLPGAPRACLDFSDPTDVSRLISLKKGMPQKSVPKLPFRTGLPEVISIHIRTSSPSITLLLNACNNFNPVCDEYQTIVVCFPRSNPLPK